MTDTAAYTAQIERPEATSDFLLVCEHASNYFPPEFGTLGLDQDAQNAHIAWDPGALELARGLAAHLDATLVHAPVSRLIYDLNRPPHARGAMAAQSETYAVPGNVDLPPQSRLARTQAIYLPFHGALRELICARLAAGRQVVLITIHSFTPVYFGQARSVEFGVIHDVDPGLANAIVAVAADDKHLNTQLNEPYSARDEVTHTLALHASPYGIENAMLEIRNDLLPDATACADMAARLAPILQNALNSHRASRAHAVAPQTSHGH